MVVLPAAAVEWQWKRGYCLIGLVWRGQHNINRYVRDTSFCFWGSERIGADRQDLINGDISPAITAIKNWWLIVPRSSQLWVRRTKADKKLTTSRCVGRTWFMFYLLHATRSLCLVFSCVLSSQKPIFLEKYEVCGHQTTTGTEHSKTIANRCRLIKSQRTGYENTKNKGKPYIFLNYPTNRHGWRVNAWLSTYLFCTAEVRNEQEVCPIYSESEKTTFGVGDAIWWKHTLNHLIFRTSLEVLSRVNYQLLFYPRSVLTKLFWDS